jgi:hypothetical protein
MDSECHFIVRETVIKIEWSKLILIPIAYEREYKGVDNYPRVSECVEGGLFPFYKIKRRFSVIRSRRYSDGWG